MSTVYVHLDADGQVLYVGKTYHPEQRTNEHRSMSRWWPQVDCVEFAGIGPDHLMRDLERRLIEEFDPPHNVAHTRAWREAQRPNWAMPKGLPPDPDSVAALMAAGMKRTSALRHARRLKPPA